jgi:ubiquitin-conjugating enzyme E2 J2
MCADEMTTGSIMATPGDRAILAKRSHAFNASQPRFKKMFPEYSKEVQVDLPNMGEESKSKKEEEAAPADSSSSKDTSVNGKEKEKDKAGRAGKVWTWDLY